MFEPASGSVIAKTILVVPAARPGSHVARCPSVPNRVMTSAEVGRRDHEQQQRGALGAEFLADQGQLGQAATSAAVLGRDGDANESRFRFGPVLYWPITSRSDRLEGLYQYGAIAL